MKFILLYGPPAVGKMTVGRELEKLSGYKLFHNHMTIEILLPFFKWGTPSFSKLNNLFRNSIFEEAAKSDLPGLIFTFVWAFNLPGEKEYIDKIIDIFKKQNAEIHFVELEATLEARLGRNKGENRLLEKPSKRDLKASEERLLKNSKEHIFNTSEKYPFPYSQEFLKIESTKLSAKDTASKILNWINDK